MDFKNKQGTVDAHNVNFDFKPENQDSHNIILNFQHQAGGSTNLNFGDDNAAWLKSPINTAFNADILAVYIDSDTNLATVKSRISTEFKSSIVAQYQYVKLKARIHTGFAAQIIAEYQNAARLKTQIDTSFQSQIYVTDVEPAFANLKAKISTAFDSNTEALFDINHLVGLFCRITEDYQQAKPCLVAPDIPWSKPIFKAHNSAFFYDLGLTISNHAGTGFEKAKPIYRAIRTAFEETSKFGQSWDLVWQENQRLFISRNIIFDDGLNLPHVRMPTWQEMIRKRRNITYRHEVAHVFEKRFAFAWDKGLEFITDTAIPWDIARAIYYRKSEIKPFPPRPIPEYVGSTDLNFVCLCHKVDSHNVVLNFGADDCIPSIPNRNWWYIVNEIEVTRLDNGQVIHVINGDYRTDRSSWCWSYNLTIPASELSKLDPIDRQPVILKIVVNGFEHLMLLENRTRSRQFAKDVYKLSGRSPSALLSPPYSAVRSFTQENERTSVQLAQAEIDRSSYPDITLNWQLIDELGWILPANSSSYANSAPMGAIKTIVDAGGGFIYSEPDSNTLTIKPLYKKTYWDSVAIEEYDKLIPESIVTDISTDYEPYPNYNGIYLTDDRTGNTGRVIRTGTAGDVLCESANSTLFTSSSVMGSFGKSKLAKAGLVETHSLQMPLTSEVGQCLPGELAAFNAEWWGIVDSVGVSFNYSSVVQTVSIERVNHE